MSKYKIEIDQKGCLSCGACYDIDRFHFEPGDFGKSNVVGGKIIESKSSGIFEDNKKDLAKDAEDACPVVVIIIIEL